MDTQLYEQEWRKRTPRLDVLNILVPKAARVEYQRLHWKVDNPGKLRVHICSQKHTMGFGKLPRAYKYAKSKTPFSDFWASIDHTAFLCTFWGHTQRQVQRPRPIATLCGICMVPLKKATFDARNSS